MDFVGGLRPRVWICVGPGYSREDIKSKILSQGQGFVSEAVTTVQDISLRILAGSKDQILGSLARQEVLRLLLSENRISSKMPELKRLRRQGAFFRRLDQAIQGGRLSFSHWEEESVYSERLEQRLGKNPIRDEVRALSRAYETWLEASKLWDPPTLIRAAIEVLAQGWPEHLSQPKEIHYYCAQTQESLEKSFWEQLSRHVEVKLITPEAQQEPQVAWDWQRWHTFDDAADYLAENITDTQNDVILISDSSSTRRSLKRALKNWGIGEADPRDPTRPRWDEGLKWAMLPLEVVARNYDRQKVVSWLRTFMQAEFPSWVNEISARGIRQGIKSYSGGFLTGVHSRLRELEESFGGRKTCTELSEAHLTYLRAQIGTRSELLWLVPLFEQLWKEFVSDQARIDRVDRKAPLLFWFERLQARLAEIPSPVERFKEAGGVQVYRLHQAAVGRVRKVWILGMPSNWLSAEGAGDYWLSEREREILGSEFAVRSGVQIRQERLLALKSWIGSAAEIVVLDAEYDPDGRERETVLPILREVVAKVSDEPTEKGSHPRWAASYSAFRPSQPQTIQLPPIPLMPDGKGPEITATALDRYSRCAFQALAFSRWELRDAREPETDLWPDVKGNILHEAVRILLSSRDAGGVFACSAQEALERAWEIKPPKGLIRGKRIENYVKSRLLLVLQAFMEDEVEYVRRAGTKVLSLEDTQFKLEYPKFTLVGKPDRIDEHTDGVFIMDYKTSGDVPHGTDMKELGYRLQLPYYALAARSLMKREVLGAQFVELTTRSKRSSGVFFKQYNGKEPGKLTQARSNSKSLFADSPDQIWGDFEEKLLSQAQAYANGYFETKPKKKEKECSTCMVGDLCGIRRIQDLGDEVDE